MTEDKSRERVAELAKQFYDEGDATGWFDALYAEADGDTSQIPWADLEPNPHLVAWLEKHPLDGANKKAVVVGCGLGDDAEKLAEYGFEVTAFDVAPKGIEWAKKLHPDTKVNYLVADLFNLPDGLKGKFDFVLEIHTIQALPVSLREKSRQSRRRIRRAERRTVGYLSRRKRRRVARKSTVSTKEKRTQKI